MFVFSVLVRPSGCPSVCQYGIVFAHPISLCRKSRCEEVKWQHLVPKQSTPYPCWTKARNKSLPSQSNGYECRMWVRVLFWYIRAIYQSYRQQLRWSSPWRFSYHRNVFICLRFVDVFSVAMLRILGNLVAGDNEDNLLNEFLSNSLHVFIAMMPKIGYAPVWLVRMGLRVQINVHINQNIRKSLNHITLCLCLTTCSIREQISENYKKELDWKP